MKIVCLEKMSTAMDAIAYLYHKYHLVLRSSKAIGKETTIVAMVLGRTAPDPGVGSPVELSGGDASGLLNLIRVGKALPSKSISSEEAPPPFLQVQPTGSPGNKDVLEPRMLGKPGAGLGTAMAAEIIGDNEDVTCRIVGFDVLKQSDVVRRVARSATPGQLLAITYS